MSELPLCECGCGERVSKVGNRFISGHNKGFLGKTHSQESKEKMLESRETTKPIPEPQLCECGCGELAKPSKRFIWGHNRQGKEMPIGTRKRISEIVNANPYTGGSIVFHHYIYDHSDISKYTMKMTRAKHAQIHAWMRKAGIKVPHINVKEDN
jgi:hypothetical protein